MRGIAGRSTLTLGLVAALGAAACAEDVGEKVGAGGSSPPLEIAHSACMVRFDATADAPATCLIDDRFVLWATTDLDASIEVVTPVEVKKARWVDGGRQWHLPPPFVTSTVSGEPKRTPRPYTAIARACRGDACAETPVRVEPPPPELLALLEAGVLELERVIQSETASTAMRCQALRELGRRAMRSSGGDVETWWSRASRCFRDIGAPDTHTRIEAARAHVLRREGKLRAALRLMNECVARARESASHCFYHRGLAHRDFGRLTDALGDWLVASRTPLRVEDPNRAAAALQALLHGFASLDRTRSASDVLHRLQDLLDEVDPGLRAAALANIGWASLLETERRRAGTELAFATRDSAFPGPEAANRRAMAAYENIGLEPPPGAVLNLSLALFLERKLAEASSLLERLGATELDPRHAALRWDLLARIALERGQPERSLDIYRRRVEPLLGDNSEINWRYRIGEARALEAMGDLDSAVDSYEEAVGILDAETTALRLGDGRSGLSRWRDQGSRALVELWARRGAWNRALEIALRALGRKWASSKLLEGLGSLDGDAVAKWEASVERYRQIRREISALEAKEEFTSIREVDARRETLERLEIAARHQLDEALSQLPRRAEGSKTPPEPGEIRLVYFPGRTQWWVIVETAAQITGVDLGTFRMDDALDPHGWSSRLLEPVRRWLSGATSVTIYNHRWLEPIDLHALPWNEHPLLESVPVRYASALGRQPREPEVAAGRVLVVADPNGDLAGARGEAREVAELLRRRHRASVTLLEDAEATPSAVVESLPRVEGFHFAGHARFDGVGLGSALELSGGAMTLADLLALPSMPSWVVLSGCETSRLDDPMAANDLALAHAFLLRGTNAVVATSRPVRDDLARRFAQTFYAKEGTVFERAWTAQRALASTAPRDDWPVFRVLVP